MPELLCFIIEQNKQTMGHRPNLALSFCCLLFSLFSAIKLRIFFFTCLEHLKINKYECGIGTAYTSCNAWNIFYLSLHRKRFSTLLYRKSLKALGDMTLQWIYYVNISSTPNHISPGGTREHFLPKF